MSPRASAPPAGTVVATAVEACISMNPCRKRSRGRAAWNPQTPAPRLMTAAAAMATHQPKLIFAMAAQASR